jgi:hypothetical protein
MHLCPTSRDGGGCQPFGWCVDRTFVHHSILNDTHSASLHCPTVTVRGGATKTTSPRTVVHYRNS